MGEPSTAVFRLNRYPGSLYTPESLVAGLFSIDHGLPDGGESIHAWADYVLGLLLCSRIVWGFIGSQNARFAGFFRPRHGFVSIVANRGRCSIRRKDIIRWTVPCIVALDTDCRWRLVAWDAFRGEDWLEDLHSLFANITLGAVAVHVNAVLIVGQLFGVSLVR